MSWRTGGEAVASEAEHAREIRARGSRERGNPLVRPGAFRRAAAAGVVGAAVTAVGLAGAGQAAAAEPVVVDTCTGEAASSSFDQPIVAAPEALDAKVKQATLLVFPLQFDRADRARQEFLSTAAASLGTVSEQDQNFSGTQLADALAPRVANLSALDGRGDEVNQHVRNLAALGCISGADVPGQDKPAPPPPESHPEPEPEPTRSPEPAPETSQEPPAPRPETEQAPQTSLAQPAPTAPLPNAAPPPAARMVPPDYSYVPGSLPPWSKTRFGQAPGMSPDVGDLLEETERAEQKRARQEQVRAAGSAEAMPTDMRNRVALPVLIAAITLAGVTSALVRTWVLRRS